MTVSWSMVLIVLPLIFLSGFIDAIAGGGGLISLPAYLFAGLPAHYAAGTGKFSSSCGLAMASFKYIKEGKVRMAVALWSALGCIVGAATGTRLALYFEERTLRMIMLAAIPLAALFLFTRKDFGKDEEDEIVMDRKKEAILSVLIGLAVGCYDGLIGPGAGTFLILGFTTVLGVDLLRASGCAKVSNMASNVTSIFLYAGAGKIAYLIGVPAAVCSMLGSYVGARYAVRGGSAKVRKVLFLVLGLLFAKLVYDLFA